MNKLIGICVLLAAGVAEAKEQTKSYTVDGWSCDGCAQKSTKAMKQIKGVTSASADVDKKLLTVVFEDSQVKEAEIAAAVKKLKFDCE